MSQEKVDEYKKEKQNRSKIMKKEKFERRLGLTITLVLLAALIGWFCWAVYGNAKATAEANADPVTTELDLSMVESYQTQLSNYADSSSGDTASESGASDESESVTAADSSADSASESTSAAGTSADTQTVSSAS
jgi:cytoskeletal protein RodZ